MRGSGVGGSVYVCGVCVCVCFLKFQLMNYILLGMPWVLTFYINITGDFQGRWCFGFFCRGGGGGGGACRYSWISSRYWVLCHLLDLCLAGNFYSVYCLPWIGRLAIPCLTLDRVRGDLIMRRGRGLNSGSWIRCINI